MIMKKIIIIARCKGKAAKYAQLNGIDGFYHFSRPDDLRGIESGSKYAITPEFFGSINVFSHIDASRLRELNKIILTRGLVRYE